MPTPRYRYDCCAAVPPKGDVPECPRCGTVGWFVGWSMTTPERVRAFGQVTGARPDLEPVDVRRLSDLVWRLQPCRLCGGRGLLDGPREGPWTWCPVCEGRRNELGRAQR